MDSLTLLSVEGLTVEIKSRSGLRQVVRGTTFRVQSGSWFGIVGESGSGKSVLASSILRMPPPDAVITSGKVMYGGSDLVQLSEPQMAKVRGRQIGMIFQNALTSLNPLFTAGEQVAGLYRFHEQASARQALEKTLEMFCSLGLPDPRRTTRLYPHQLSGGMAQRVMIAMALVCSPRLLIADDPTSTLDPTIQAQVLDVLVEQATRKTMSVLLISRDMRLVKALCSEIAVMRAGEIVETGAVGAVINNPAHRYTAQLVGDAGLALVQPSPHV